MQPNHSHMISVLDELTSLAKNNSSTSLIQEIEEERKKLHEGTFYLVVVGQFKRGKTSLLNALLGENVLPAGVIPLTAIVTLIKYGNEKEARVTFANGTRMTVSFADLPQFVTETQNPHNEKNVHSVEIIYPAEVLQNGIVLVDTPGIGSTFEHNTITTNQFIPKIDAAIFVLSPDPPITKTEQEFLEKLSQHVKKIFVAFNKIDLLTDEAFDELFTFTQGILAKLSQNASFHIIPISCLQGLEAKLANNKRLLEESGIADVEHALRLFAAEEKNNVLLERSVQRVRSLIDKIRFDTELEVKATLMPVDELTAKISAFEKESAAILKEREHFAFLLQGEIKALQQRVDEEVDSFGAQEFEKLKSILRERFLAMGNEFERDALEQDIAKQLIADFDTWRASYEEEVRQRYQTLANTYIQKTNEHITRIAALSQSLFDIRLNTFDEAEPLRWQKRFYYKIDDDPVFLEIDISGLLLNILPATRRKKKILQRLTSAAQRKVQRTCGNLAYEYTYSIQESFRSFSADLQTKLQTVLNEISAILHKAKGQKMMTQEKSVSLVQHLEQHLHQLHQLQQRVESTTEDADRITA
jgi:small GTP-binding protein